MLVLCPPSAWPLLGLGLCGDSICFAGSIPSSESRVVGWGGPSADLGPGRHGDTPSYFPNASADNYQLQSLLLIYFSFWLLIFEEQGPACSVVNIASLTCSIVVEPNLGVVCLFLTYAVLNTD